MTMLVNFILKITKVAFVCIAWLIIDEKRGWMTEVGNMVKSLKIPTSTDGVTIMSWIASEFFAVQLLILSYKQLNGLLLFF